MFVFPFIYITAFLVSLRNLMRDKVQGILLFFIFGLSIYTIALSLSFLYGFSKAIPFLQSFKELTILSYLGYLLYNLKSKIHFHIVDKLILAFFFYVLIYIFLPLGSYGFFQKILAFKSLCFFPLVYFTGRLINTDKINLSEAFHYFCLLSIVASCVLLFEVLSYTHLQTFTGYADYNYYFFDQEPSGNYGLSWTFEIESGLKRFASFFANPLEFAAATLITVSALAAMVTDNQNKIVFTSFITVTLACTFFSIVYSLSRASFASYFIIIYTFAFITGKKFVLRAFHFAILLAISILIFFTIEGDFIEFIVNTFQFTNASSLGHLAEWLNGLQAMAIHPLGMGLGESGRVSAFAGFNTGGENQFIIIGVQTGIIALLIYLVLYGQILAAAFKSVKKGRGKLKKLGIFVLLIKMGLLIPLFTAEIESYIYISYITWFFSGLLISRISKENLLAQKQ